MRDDLTHLIALTIDRSDWIISEISRGKRPYSPVPFFNGELFNMNMPVVEKMGKNRRIEFNPASTDFIDWLTVSFRLFTEILQLVTCWLVKEKRVK